MTDTATERTEGRIRKILIVGGGTAGWLSAAYLQRALSPDTEITLVESPEVPTIGVGEATIPTLRFTFDFLGLEEAEWMPACNASFKMAIKFVNWLHGEGEHYYHTFTNRSTERVDTLINPWGRPYFPDLGRGLSPMHYWVEKKLRGDSVEPYALACIPGTDVCDHKKAPRCPERPELTQPSAYHFDASYVARYLSKVAQERGVRRVPGHVESVEKAEDGSLSAVVLRDGRRLEAEMFIDCTGFRSLLIGQALQEPFESDSDHLLIDNAVAINCPHDAPREGLNSFTTATAQSAGWTWDIPLYHRSGTGYVYSSKFIDKDAAERELREFLGPRHEGIEARHIKLRVGKRRNLWVKNCVAMGLAGSFLEPLESTSIFMTEYQLANLITFFPDKRFADARIRAYNKIIRATYEDVRDFIVLHYVLSKRRDTPFWVEATRDEVIPDSLRERLEFFRESVPVVDEIPVPVFRAPNYAQVLAGMDYLPGHSSPLLAHFDDEHGERMLQNVRKEREEALAAMPGHYEYLQQLHAAYAARHSGES